MGDFLDQVWKIIVLILTHLALGRRGSYPYGLLVNFSLVKITVMVVISDMILTVGLLHLFELSFEKVGFLRKLKSRLNKKEKKESQKSLWGKIKKWRGLGIIIIAALPYGGGALTGSILASSIKMEKKQAFLFITIGCIIGAILFYLGCIGILAVFR
jgi:uncharacterized membrane protein